MPQPALLRLNHAHLNTGNVVPYQAQAQHAQVLHRELKRNYQACEAGEGIIGHRGIRFVCLSVVCLSVCLSVIKLLPAYGADHSQNSYLVSLGHCEGQSRFDIGLSPIPCPQTSPQKLPPKMQIFIFLTY